MRSVTMALYTQLQGGAGGGPGQAADARVLQVVVRGLDILAPATRTVKGEQAS
jgi:hypothetical protein